MSEGSRREGFVRTAPAAVLAAALLAGGPGSDGLWANEAGAAKEAVAMKEAVAAEEDPVVVEMAVRGMACAMCVRALDRRLNAEVEDLEDLEIDLETGRVTFRLPDGSKHTDDELREIVRSAGFSVDRVNRIPDGEPGA